MSSFSCRPFDPEKYMEPKKEEIYLSKKKKHAIICLVKWDPRRHESRAFLAQRQYNIIYGLANWVLGITIIYTAGRRRRIRIRIIDRKVFHA